MKILFLSFALMFALGSVSSAEEVLDPHHVLDQISMWIHPVDFKQAFTCGKSFAYTATDSNCTETCTNSFCQAQCYGAGDKALKPQLYLENCTDHSLSIYSDNGWSLDVTKEDYIRGGSTLIVPIFKNIGHYLQPSGNVVIRSAMPMYSYDYIHDGDKERIMSVTVEAEIESNTAQKSQIELILSRTAFGVEQVLLLTHGPNTEFLRLKGVYDVH